MNLLSRFEALLPLLAMLSPFLILLGAVMLDYFAAPKTLKAKAKV